MKQGEKYKVIQLIAPYVKPQEIKEKFGLTYNEIDHYCKTYDIPKWRRSLSERKREAIDTFNEEEAYAREIRIRMAQDLLNEDYSATEG